MVRMKALTSFGYAGVNEGPVKRGREFIVETERRAHDLEEAGLAFRLESKMLEEPENKMQPPPQNKAAETGPLDSRGGKTGANATPQSSQADHPRRQRPSVRSKRKSSRS